MGEYKIKHYSVTQQWLLTCYSLFIQGAVDLVGHTCSVVGPKLIYLYFSTWFRLSALKLDLLEKQDN